MNDKRPNAISRSISIYRNWLLAFFAAFLGIVAIAFGGFAAQAEDAEQVAIVLEQTEHGRVSFIGTGSDEMMVGRHAEVGVKVEPDSGYVIGDVKMTTASGIGSFLHDDDEDGVYMFNADEDCSIIAYFAEGDDLSNAALDVTADERGIDDSLEYIRAHMDAAYVGESDELVPADYLTTVLLEAHDVESIYDLWDEPDERGASTDWDHFDNMTYGYAYLYEADRDADYYVGYVDTLGADGVKVIDFEAGRNDTTGTVYDDVVYDYDTGLVYVPKRYRVIEDGTVVLDSVRVELLYETPSESAYVTTIDVKVNAANVDGTISDSGVATASSLGDVTVINLAKDDEAIASINELTFDSVSVNGVEYGMESDVIQYDGESGELLIDMPPATVSDVEINLSNTFIKNLRGIFWFLSPKANASSWPQAEANLLSGTLTFSVTPKVGDTFESTGTNYYDVSGTPGYTDPVFHNRYYNLPVEDIARVVTGVLSMNYIDFSKGTSVWNSSNPRAGVERSAHIEEGTYTTSSGAQVKIPEQYVNLFCGHISIGEGGNKSLMTDTRKEQYWRILKIEGNTMLVAIVNPTLNTQAGAGIFKAKWTVSDGKLSIEKTVSNQSAIASGAAAKNAEFTFTISGLPNGTYKYSGSKNGTLTISGGKGTIKLKHGQRVTVEGLPNGVSYKVNESSVAGFKQTSASGTSGEIQANKTKNVSFTNAYNPTGTWTPSIVKILRGKKTMNAGDATFVLSKKIDDTHSQVVQTVSTVRQSSASSQAPFEIVQKVAFSPIKLTQADVGKTYTYTVHEVNGGTTVKGVNYDSQVITYKITVKDNGDGTLSSDPAREIVTRSRETRLLDDEYFENEYHAKGSTSLTMYKYLEGRRPKDGEFAFSLFDTPDTESATPIETVTNDADGTIRFSKMEFDENDIGEHVFYVREVSGSDSSLIYDDVIRTVTLKIFDNYDGTLGFIWVSNPDDSFKNSVKPGNLTVEKVLENGTDAAKENEFAFAITLVDADGNPLDAHSYPYRSISTPVGKKGHTGKVKNGTRFYLWAGEKIEITGLPNGSHYEISEIPKKGFEIVASETSSLSGTITSDESVDATVSETVTNRYSSSGTASVSAYKQLVGETLVGGEFTFGLYSDAECTQQIGEPVSNGAGGTVSFQNYIGFNQNNDGVPLYVYIKEIVPDEQDPTIEYSDEVICWKITPIDHGDGTMSAGAVLVDSATFEPLQSAPVITNTKKPGRLNIRKKTDDASGNDTVFKFMVELENPNVSLDASNIQIDSNVKRVIGDSNVRLSRRFAIYQGVPVELPVSVSMDNGVSYLTEGTDYTVEYANNDAPGEATVTIIGMGDYIGTVTKSFNIIKLFSASSANMTNEQMLDDANANGIDSDGEALSDEADETEEPSTYEADSVAVEVDGNFGNAETAGGSNGDVEREEDAVTQVVEGEDKSASSYNVTIQYYNNKASDRVDTQELHTDSFASTATITIPSVNTYASSCATDSFWRNFNKKTGYWIVSSKDASKRAAAIPSQGGVVIKEGSSFKVSDLVELLGLKTGGNVNIYMYLQWYYPNQFEPVYIGSNGGTFRLNSGAPGYAKNDNRLKFSVLVAHDGNNAAIELSNDWRTSYARRIGYKMTGISDTSGNAMWDANGLAVAGKYWTGNGANAQGKAPMLSNNDWYTDAKIQWKPIDYFFDVNWDYQQLDSEHRLKSFNVEKNSKVVATGVNDYYDVAAHAGDAYRISNIKIKDGYHCVSIELQRGGGTLNVDGTLDGFTYMFDDNIDNTNLNHAVSVNTAPDTYTIQYDSNGGIGTMLDTPLKSDDGIALSHGVVSRNSFFYMGKRFVGFNTAADGSGISVAPGTDVTGETFGWPGNGAAITLYAQWSDLSSEISGDTIYLELTGNTEANISLPAGTKYKVYEQTTDGWHLVSSSGTTGNIEPLKTNQAIFENAPGAPTDVPVNLTAVKYLDGRPCDDGNYSFTLTPVENSPGTVQTKTNKQGDGGYVYFDEIVFTEPGTYTYTITEDAGNKTGVIYDTHIETATVTVSETFEASVSYSHESSGETVTDDDAVFRNTTNPGALKIIKNVSATSVPRTRSATFNFTVELKDPLGNPIPNGTYGDLTVVDGTANVSIELDANESTSEPDKSIEATDLPSGTVYTVVELCPAGWKTTSPSDGRIGGVIESDTTKTASFTNEYTIDINCPIGPVVTATFHKSMDGYAFQDGEFTFKLKMTKVNGETIAPSDEYTGSINADGTCVLDEPLFVENAGTYTFEIAEDAGNNRNIRYDVAKREFDVVVEDNGEGQLVVASSAINTELLQSSGYSASALIVNEPITRDITVRKTVESGTADGMFEATISLIQDGEPLDGQYNVTVANGTVNGSDNQPISTVGNGSTVRLSACSEFTIQGVPADTVASVSETLADQSQDGVHADGDGVFGWIAVKPSDTLTVEAEGGDTVLELVNRYKTENNPAPVTWAPQAKKVGTNFTPQADEFSFELLEGETVVATGKNAADGTIAFSEVHFDASDASSEGTGKQHTYTMREVIGDDDSVIYDTREVEWTVCVKANGDGTLTITPSFEKEIGDLDTMPVFSNTKKNGNLVVRKIVNWPEGTAAATKQTKFDISISFYTVDTDGEEVPYRYDFAYSGTLSGNKSGDSSYNFEFSDGDEIIIQVPDGIHYRVIENEVSLPSGFSKEDETNTDGVIQYDEDSIATIENGYSMQLPSMFSIEANKTLLDSQSVAVEPLPENMFAFVLENTTPGSDSYGKKWVEFASNDGSVSFSDFDDITEPGTYTYTLRELNPQTDDLSDYGHVGKRVVIEWADSNADHSEIIALAGLDAADNPTAEDVYIALGNQIASVSWDDEEPHDDHEAAYTAAGFDSSDTTITAQQVYDALVSLGVIDDYIQHFMFETYADSNGILTQYAELFDRVEEVVPSTVATAAAGVGAYGYDSHVETITIRVDDDGAGNLAPSITYSSGNERAEFENELLYGDLKITKSLVNATPAAEGEEFTLNVTLESNQEGEWEGDTFIPSAISGTFAAERGVIDGSVAPTSEQIVFGEDGKAEITISGDEYVLISDIPANAAYTVTENPSAGFTLSPTDGVSGVIIADDISYANLTNTYDASTTWKPDTITKTYNGSVPEEGQFVFGLYRGTVDSANLIQSKSNDDEGFVAFDDVSFGVEDVGKTYTYIIAEKDMDDTTIAYDTHHVEYTFTVQDDGRGHITLSPAPSAATAVGSLVFDNTDKTGALEISKIVDGAYDDSTVFSFTIGLKDTDGHALVGTYPWSDGASNGTVSDGGKVNIRAGGSLTISGIPNGTVYSVSEDDADGFKLISHDGDTGVIVSNETKEATFTNSVSFGVPTGENISNATAFGLIAIGIGGLVAMAAICRKIGI